MQGLSRAKILASLFGEFFRLSLFVVGGGYAIISVADEACAKRGWTEEGEIVDRLGVFQMLPGLIATHTAVYVGGKVAGAVGAFLGVVAVALPSIVVFTFVSAGYSSLPLDAAWLASAFVGLRAALAGIIAATLVRALRRVRGAFAVSLFALALVALALVGVPVWAVVLVASAAGVAAEFGAAAPGGTTFRSPAWLGTLLFLKYGLLCFGGGFVLVPMYIEDFVGAAAPYLQVSESEFGNLMALTQMTPGPIGVNGATFFGYRLAGVAGAVVASAALLLPGSILAFFAFRSLARFRTSRFVCGLLRGVHPASAALMCVALGAFAKMCFFYRTGAFCPAGIVLVAFAAVVALRRRMNPVLLIALCALASAAAGSLGLLRTDLFA